MLAAVAFGLYVLALGAALVWVWPRPVRGIWLLLALLPLHTLGIALVFHFLHPSRTLLTGFQVWKDVVVVVALLRLATRGDGWSGQRFHPVDLAVVALTAVAVGSMLLHRRLGLGREVLALRDDFMLVPFYAMGRLTQIGPRARTAILWVVAAVGVTAAAWGIVERIVDPIPLLRAIELPAFEKLAYGLVFASPYGLPYNYFQANFARRVGSFVLSGVGFATLGSVTLAAGLGLLRGADRLGHGRGLGGLAAIGAGVLAPVLAAGRLNLLITPVLLATALVFVRRWQPILAAGGLLVALYLVFSATFYVQKYPDLPRLPAAEAAVVPAQPAPSPTPTGAQVTPLVPPGDESISVHLRSIRDTFVTMGGHPLGSGLGQAGLSAVRGGVQSGEGQFYVLAAELGAAGFLAALALLALGGGLAWRAARAGPEPGFALAALLMLITVVLTLPIAEVFTDLFAMAACFWCLGQLVRVVAAEETAARPVLVDITCLRTAQAGVRSYTAGLLSSLRAVDPHVLSTGAPVPGYRPSESAVRKLARHLLLVLWYQVGLPLLALARGARLLVCPEYYCPRVAPCPRVVVFHDTLFWDRDEYPGWWRTLLGLNALGPARRANLVVTPSASQVAGLARLLRRPEHEIVVLPPLINPTPAPADLDGDLRRLGLAAGYVLHLGAMERRKDIPALVESYAGARDGQPDWPPLVLAGPRSPIAALDDLPSIERMIAKHDLEPVVRVLGMVPDASLPALLHGAAALAFVSRAEGFGLPLAEAMAAGVPVVAFDTATTAEVVDGAGLLVPAGDREALAGALRRVLADSSLRAELGRRGRERAERYGPEAAGMRLRKLMTRLVAAGGTPAPARRGTDSG